MALLIISCSKQEVGDLFIPKAANDVQVEQQLMTLVNAHRTALGYQSLEFSQVAYSYANEHTDYMIAKGDISHDNFTARASSIAKEAGAEEVAENVAKDYDTAQEAFDSWMASSSHRKTMEGDYTHTAVSVKKNSAGKLYFTQLFFR